MEKSKRVTVYDLDGRPPLGEAIAVGMQHVLAMFIGNIAPIIIVSDVLNLDPASKALLLQCAMFVAGVVTLIQLYPIGPFGARLPLVMGVSASHIPTLIAIGIKYGMPGILGSSLVGGIAILIIGVIIKRIKHLIPTFISGLVVLSIGLSLISIGIYYFGGGQDAADFGSPSNLILAVIVFVIIVFFKQFTKGITSVSSILIGITAGYVIAIFMGKVDFSPVQAASWIQMPMPFQFGMTFHLDAIIIMIMMGLVTSIETMGDTDGVTIGGALNRRATDKEIIGSIMTDGIGTIFSAIFNVFPKSTFSQNVGIVSMTKVVNRFSVAMGAIFLIICGFFPKVGALLSVMPASVLGGAAIIMFSSILVVGIKLLTLEPLTDRTSLIITISIGFGYGLTLVPDIVKFFPDEAKLILGSSGVAITVFMALILHAILPKDDQEDAELEEVTDARQEMWN